MGDYNSVLDQKDKSSGKQVAQASNSGFRRFIDSGRLIDLGYNGAAFTWNNKRKVRENIQECLDRGFISDDWRVLFPQAYITYLTTLNIDHRPLLLNTTPNNIPRACLFRFETM